MSIVVGAVPGILNIDDVLVEQQVAPPPAPPSPPPPAPPLAPLVLYEDFDGGGEVVTKTRQPWPPPDPSTKAGAALAAAHAAMRAPVHASVLPAAEATAPGKMWAKVPSPSVGRSGGYCARLDVKEAYEPAFRARLELGKHIILLGELRVTFWARVARVAGHTDRRLAKAGRGEGRGEGPVPTHSHGQAEQPQAGQSISVNGGHFSLLVRVAMGNSASF